MSDYIEDDYVEDDCACAGDGEEPDSWYDTEE
jgi:hypothetical protein